MESDRKMLSAFDGSANSLTLGNADEDFNLEDACGLLLEDGNRGHSQEQLAWVAPRALPASSSSTFAHVKGEEDDDDDDTPPPREQTRSETRSGKRGRGGGLFDGSLKRNSLFGYDDQQAEAGLGNGQGSNGSTVTNSSSNDEQEGLFRITGLTENASASLPNPSSCLLEVQQSGCASSSGQGEVGPYPTHDMSADLDHGALSAGGEQNELQLLQRRARNRRHAKETRRRKKENIDAMIRELGELREMKRVWDTEHLSLSSATAGQRSPTSTPEQAAESRSSLLPLPPPPTAPPAPLPSATALGGEGAKSKEGGASTEQTREGQSASTVELCPELYPTPWGVSSSSVTKVSSVDNRSVGVSGRDRRLQQQEDRRVQQECLRLGVSGEKPSNHAGQDQDAEDDVEEEDEEEDRCLSRARSRSRSCSVPEEDDDEDDDEEDNVHDDDDEASGDGLLPLRRRKQRQRHATSPPLASSQLSSSSHHHHRNLRSLWQHRLQEVLNLRAQCERRAEAWATHVEDSVELVHPFAPYRSHTIKSKVAVESRSVGIASLISDAQSLAVALAAIAHKGVHRPSSSSPSLVPPPPSLPPPPSSLVLPPTVSSSSVAQIARHDQPSPPRPPPPPPPPSSSLCSGLPPSAFRDGGLNSLGTVDSTPPVTISYALAGSPGDSSGSSDGGGDNGHGDCDEDEGQEEEEKQGRDGFGGGEVWSDERKQQLEGKKRKKGASAANKKSKPVDERRKDSALPPALSVSTLSRSSSGASVGGASKDLEDRPPDKPDVVFGDGMHFSSRGVMCAFQMKSSNLVAAHQKRCEVIKVGTVRAEFSPTTNKISLLEFSFDAVSFWRQIQHASSPEHPSSHRGPPQRTQTNETATQSQGSGLKVVPNLYSSAIRPTPSEARLVLSATSPLRVCFANDAFRKLCGDAGGLGDPQPLNGDTPRQLCAGGDANNNNGGGGTANTSTAGNPGVSAALQPWLKGTPLSDCLSTLFGGGGSGGSGTPLAVLLAFLEDCKARRPSSMNATIPPASVIKAGHDEKVDGTGEARDEKLDSKAVGCLVRLCPLTDDDCHDASTDRAHLNATDHNHNSTEEGEQITISHLLLIFTPLHGQQN